MFERMVIAEQVFKCGNISKNTNRAEANHESRERKHKVGEAASPINPEKGRAGKRKTNVQAIQVIGQLVQKHYWCTAPGTLRKSEKSLKE